MSAENIAIEEFKNVIYRIEQLQNAKADFAEKINEAYASAKNRGYDVKIMKQIVKLRKLSDEEREESELLLSVYKRALGMEKAPDRQISLDYATNCDI